MSATTQDNHAKAGQLYAALWALRLLATSEGRPPEPTGLLAKDVPRNTVADQLKSLPEHLLRARKLTADRWNAAVEVYQEIPRLLPVPGLPGATMSPREQRLFADAYDERLKAYRAKYAKLLPEE